MLRLRKRAFEYLSNAAAHWIGDLFAHFGRNPPNYEKCGRFEAGIHAFHGVLFINIFTF